MLSLLQSIPWGRVLVALLLLPLGSMAVCSLRRGVETRDGNLGVKVLGHSPATGPQSPHL